MSMKKSILIFLIIIFLIGTSGCGKKTSVQPEVGQLTVYEEQDEKPIPGGMLRLALSGAKSLNPILAENRNNLQILGLIFDGLFTRAANDATELNLCESYTISADGLCYEFKLKDNVSFHNGARLSAQDVIATLDLLFATESVLAGRLADVASYEARGMTVIVNLNRPVANFIALLDFPILSVSDLGTVENAVSSASAYVPNGTGRYKVQSYKKSKELYLSVNQNYHRAFEPHISEIKVVLLRDRETAVSMLENMQIDLLPSEIVDLYQYTPKRNLSSCEYIGGRFTFVGLNNQQAALLTARTRIALAVSIDKVNLLTHSAIQYAEPSDLPIPNYSCWNDAQLSTVGYDTAYAKSLLAEDGWFDSDGDGILDKEVYGEKVDLIFEILVNEENPARVKIAGALKGYLEAAGVWAHVKAVPFADYEQQIAAKDYDLFIGEVALSENYDLSFLFKTDENVFGFSGEETDRLLTELSLETNENQKQELYHDLCGVLKREMPMIGLYFEYEMIVFDNRLKGGIHPSSSDAFYGIDQWFLSEE